MHHHRILAALTLLLSCAPLREGCVPDGEPRTLPDEVREASGIAWSRAHPDVLWVHNDSDGGPTIFAVDTHGRAIGSAELRGAHNRDWEDIAIARCPHGGPEGDCIYIADIGDNRAAREGVGIWVAAEPDPRGRHAADAVFYRIRYPDGPRDAEALVALDDGSLLIVSKGREHPVSVYRSTPLEWGDPPAAPTLRLVQQLSAGPVDLPLQITGAADVRDGAMIALRSYSQLQFYHVGADSLTAVLEEPVALDSLGEPQGEGVAVGRRGRVMLASEAGPQAIAPRLTPLRCRLP